MYYFLKNSFDLLFKANITEISYSQRILKNSEANPRRNQKFVYEFKFHSFINYLLIGFIFRIAYMIRQSRYQIKKKQTHDNIIKNKM